LDEGLLKGGMEVGYELWLAKFVAVKELQNL
jgi:hypothetical protein